jgi:translation initiation factor 1 (eIF-1/SUI1)
VQIVLERRGGNKIVTLVRLLELYHADLAEVAHEMQTIAAARFVLPNQPINQLLTHTLFSTTVSTHGTGKGEKPQVLIQGPAVVFLMPYLECKFGIKSHQVDVVDKTKGAKLPKPSKADAAVVASVKKKCTRKNIT